jgi:hypothetical protein
MCGCNLLAVQHATTSRTAEIQALTLSEHPQFLVFHRSSTALNRVACFRASEKEEKTFLENFLSPLSRSIVLKGAAAERGEKKRVLCACKHSLETIANQLLVKNYNFLTVDTHLCEVRE